MKSTPPVDQYTIHCPRLGHQIPFSYCRSENQGLPCFKIIDCWYDHFLIEEFLREELAGKDWDEVFKHPLKPKLALLAELIDKARKHQDT